MNWKLFAFSVLYHFDWAVFYYFIFVNGFYTMLLILSIPELFRNYALSRDENLKRLFESDASPAITLLAPAYNEEATIVESLSAMLTIEYPDLQVVVVNDGSGDRTMDVLKTAFSLFEMPPVFRRLLPTAEVRALYRSHRFSALTVVDKENGGKADALNAALNVAGTPLVCAMDADTLIEPDALLRMVRPFLMKENTVAAGGTIRIANDCVVDKARVVKVRPPRRFLPAVQVVEYLRAFLFGRLGINRLGGNLVISGAFGLFSRKAVLDAGGWLRGTVGEDMELVVRMHRIMCEKRTPYLVDFIPDPVAWTEAPETLKVLSRQRERWHRGLTDTLARHKIMFCNPRYGPIGMIVFPYFVIVEWLAPVVELLGYAGLAIGLWFGIVDWFFAALFFSAAYGLGVVLSLFSIVLEEAFYQRFPRTRHILYLVAIALLENLGYRQLTVLWRVKGIVRYLRGETSWGRMERRGFKSS